jgi:hypothetical protein
LLLEVDEVPREFCEEVFDMARVTFRDEVDRRLPNEIGQREIRACGISGV